MLSLNPTSERPLQTIMKPLLWAWWEMSDAIHRLKDHIVFGQASDEPTLFGFYPFFITSGE
jgi:hypothetical protein